MCIDGDNAGHVAEYINSQLHALHKIAEECHGHALENVEHGLGEHPSTLPGYDFALAGFYHQQTSALSSSRFSVTFGTPVVDFICNHDALIHLNIHEAILTTARRATGSPYGAYNNKPATAEPPAELAKESLSMHGTISIRVPYVKFDLTGQADIIGHAPHTINTLIFDMPHARIVTTHETTIEVAEAFRPSIEAYLKHFQKSGHHILHCLPSFDDPLYQRTMDFSAVTAHSYGHIQEMYNIHRDKIVTYLQESWRTAAWQVQEKGTSLATRKSIAIAEWTSAWSHANEDDWHFHVKFGAPKVELLCEHEAIVYLQVDEVMFSESTTFGPTAEVHRGWQIALVVDIHQFVEEDGAIQILSIDTKHGGKFAQALSTFIGFDLENDINLQKFTRLITFLSLEYLQILEEGGFYFYRYDSRLSSFGRGGGATDIFIGHTHGGEDYSTNIISQADMRGFQQIILLSQLSIDEVYSAYYREYTWMQRYRMGKNFELEFGPLRIRLLSNNRALVFVQIKAGSLRTLRDGKPWEESEKHQIGEWELAFDVGIKLVESTEFDDTYRGTAPHKLAEKFKETHLQQLVLDFENMEFKFGLSRFNDPAFGYTRLSLEKAAAAQFYLRSYYFKNMLSTTAHILHTVTLSHDITENRPRYAFSKAVFHIYSKTTVTHTNYNLIPPGEEPVIAILGMTNPNLPLPSNILRWSTNWLLGYGSTLGTLALSRDIFLHGRLLPLLEGINRATTLLPASLDMDAGNWLVKLTTWKDKYAGALNRAASWEELPKTRNAFEFKWDYTDEYEYNHEGRAADNATGTNFLSMKTDNRLTIPTTFKAGQMDISIRGTTTFAIGWTRADEEVRLSSVASWAIVISAVTNADGLKISVAQEFARNIADETVKGEIVSASRSQLRPKTMLESSFPEKVALTEEIKALETFEGVWRCLYPGLGSYKLANPFFTDRGDLLVELRSDSPSTTKPVIRPSLGVGRPSVGAARPRIVRPSSLYGKKNGSTPTSPYPTTPYSALPTGSPHTPSGLKQPMSKGGAAPDPFTNGNGTAPANGNGAPFPDLDKPPIPPPMTASNDLGDPFGKAADE